LVPTNISDLKVYDIVFVEVVSLQLLCYLICKYVSIVLGGFRRHRVPADVALTDGLE